METYKKIFTVMFMVLLLGFSTYNMFSTRNEIKQEISELKKPKTLKEIKNYTLSIDNTLATNLAFGHAWNEAYGKVYKAFGKNEENSFLYVKDKDGVMYSGNFWNNTDVAIRDYAMRIKRLESAVADKGTKVVVLLYPTQYNEEWSDGYYGIPYNDYNDYHDELVSYLRYLGINYIDYKQVFLDKNMKAQDIFFKTDHHWRIEVAFDSFAIMVNYLNENLDAKLDTYYTDLQNYDVKTYKNVFLGSQGRDAGIAYAGLDDYTFILPKFKTYYEYTFEHTPGAIETLKGNIKETLFSDGYLYIKDFYNRDMYCSYLNGIQLNDHIVNKMNEDGLKVLFLRDSYTSPLATFFASYCSELDMLWTVQTEPAKIEAKVEEGNYDYIFVAMVIDSIVNNGANFYMDEEVTNE